MGEKKKDVLSSFLPLLLIPIMLGAFTGIMIKKDIFTSSEEQFKQLINSTELDYSSQELETITTNTTSLEVPKVLDLYVANETDDGIYLASNTTNYKFKYENGSFYYGDDMYVKVVLTSSTWTIDIQGVDACHNVEHWRKDSTSGNTYNYVNTTVCNDYHWQYTNGFSSGEFYLKIDGVMVIEANFGDGTIEKNITLYSSNVDFKKGIRTEDLTVNLGNVSEIIIVTSYIAPINSTILNYKLVADWDDNIKYSIEEIQYQEDFVNAINRFFKPTTYYKLKFGEDTWEFKKAKDYNVMALFDNATITLTAQDKANIVYLIKDAELTIENNQVKINSNNVIDAWIRLEPYNATLTGKVYFYSYSVLDRIIGFFKSLLRFDLSDAMAYATATKEYNQTTMTAVEPEYINLLTKLGAGEYILSDSSAPADINYADNTFSTLFAVKYPTVKCIFVEDKAICGKVFIVAQQNNIYYILAS